MVQVKLFGPIDSILGAQVGVGEVLVVEAVLLVLVVANFLTRKLAHDRHLKQAEEGADAVTRFLPHEAMNIVLLLVAFYYMTASYHGGFISSMFVVGLIITDIFEFEARKAEARRGVALQRPKGSLATATFLLAYVGYQTLFFLLKGPVSLVI
jgi:hypothetical protein